MISFRWPALSLLLVLPTFAFGSSDVSPDVSPDVSAEADQLLVIEDLQFKILPPKDWKSSTDFDGLSLVIEKPLTKKEEKLYGKVTYMKNITVAVKNKGIPIDDAQAQILIQDLTENFTSGAGISEYRMSDKHQIIDLQGKRDALVLYSNFQFNGTPMAQLHMVVSNENHQYLLSYTDLASQFEGADFQSAWAAMSSVEIEGESPSRYGNIILYGGILFVILLVLSCFGYLHFRKVSDCYRKDGDQVYSDMESDDGPLTKSEVWQLNSGH